MTMGTPQAIYDFKPDRPINWQPIPRRDVIMIPWGENVPGGARRAAGLVDENRAFMPEGHCWRSLAAPITVAPIPPEIAEPVEMLNGRWMFGGLFYAHFGHFLVETTARLWAAPQIEDLDGIVFYPKQKMTHEWRYIRDMVPFFAQCGLGHLKIRAPQKPVAIDELLTPPPGFGMSEMIAGRPEYRAWVRTAMGRDVAPSGADNIYVSRAHLPSKRGTILRETWLETLMAAAGYAIIHPQEMSFASQIAQWKAAKRIVGLDGSAFHLAAMFVRPDAQVALINRGPSQNIEDYILQFRHFAGVEARRIDAIAGCWAREGQRFVKREVLSRLDFAAAGKALVAAGFLADSEGWIDPPEAEVMAEIDALSARLGAPLTYRKLN